MAFADGDILSASQLNDLVNRVNALEDQRIGVNLGFAEVSLTVANPDVYYQVVHTYDYLHLRYNIPNDDTILRVYYNGTLVRYNDNSGDEAENIYLPSLVTLTKGTQYQIRVNWSEDNSNGEPIQFRYMVETEEEL